LLVCFTLLYF